MTSLKCEQTNFSLANFDRKHLTLNEELLGNAGSVPTSRNISYDSPTSPDQPQLELPAPPQLELPSPSQNHQQQQQQHPLTINFESRADVNGLPVSSTSGPLKITGQVKLNVTSNPISDQEEPIVLEQPRANSMKPQNGRRAQPEKEEYKFNCCSEVLARVWGTFFD